MAQLLSDPGDQEFLLFEIFNIDSFSNSVKFSDFNKKTCKMILKEARKLAVEELIPSNKEADVHNGHPDGVNFINGEILVPKSYHIPYENFCKGGWLAMCDEEQWGGQNMPQLLAGACVELFMGANPSFFNYPALTHGAGAIVKEFGNDLLKQKYLKNMFSGKWAGTMCLTESQAGSDVGAVDTKAFKNQDGTYSIEGNKIFISGADSDLVENVIHPVLARTENAPSGTSGISLFLVPKYRLDDQGKTTNIKNDVEITGIEEKLGMHGNVTCSVSFGSKKKCTGELVGKENKGMKYMFLMMNEARQGAALQALGISSASYANAVNYAKERIQGPDLLEAAKDNPVKVPIIQHPDVRRELLTMKALIEGNRFLSYYLKWCTDKANITKNNDQKEKFKNIIELLTPVSKAYTTFKGIDITASGIKVFGGYGFIEEYPQAQFYRDVRISSIYEGTNGIQAMDLLGRKLGMKQGKPFLDLMNEIQKTVKKAENSGLNNISEKLSGLLSKAGEAAASIGKTASGENILDAFGSASIFLESVGDLCMAWAHAEKASTAAGKIESSGKKDKTFYQAILKTAEFYYDVIVPESLGRLDSLKKITKTVMSMPEAGFASK
ncbi:MAG: acyl-CoA dehydrogenase [Thermodesulfobacteriota bacterium]